jgi:hypothetical protein
MSERHDLFPEQSSMRQERTQAHEKARSLCLVRIGIGVGIGIGL